MVSEFAVRQRKARSAGNIEHIGKGRNAAVAHTASARRARRQGPAPDPQANNGAITSDTIAITLMRMFMLGPEVSLKGSPTVSPTTVAA